MKHKSTFFKKADILLLLIFIIAALASFALLRPEKQSGAYAVVTAEGWEIGRYPLNRDMVLEIQSGGGHNTVEIKDGTVAVTHADCPNGDCVSYGSISCAGQVILCLPHKLAISIEGEEGEDAISY